jgi:hypothetical protein
MARMATKPAAVLALIAAFPMLASCAAPAPSAADAFDGGLPSFGWAPRPRMRAPSAERPAWLPSLPAEQPRLPAPGYGFRA